MKVAWEGAAYALKCVGYFDCLQIVSRTYHPSCSTKDVKAERPGH